MKFPIDVLRDVYKIEAGRIYRGRIFSKSREPHKAVIFYVSKAKETVYAFAITSQSDTIRYFSSVVSEKAVVELPESEAVRLYGSGRKKSWIYCGKPNISQIPTGEFLSRLQENEIVPFGTLPQELFEELVFAVRSSISYSDDDLKELGLPPAP